MKYSSTKEKKELKQFWDGEIAKKLFRCSKEFGFYPKLKKILKSKYSSENDAVFFQYADSALHDLRDNKLEVLSFARLIPDEYMQKGLRITYPVYTAFISKRHLCHIIALSVLNNCKISHEIRISAFIWLTREIFEGHNIKANLKEKIGYIKLFFS